VWDLGCSSLLWLRSEQKSEGYCQPEPMLSPLHARPPERERSPVVGRWRNPCSSGRREARGAEMAASERRSAATGVEWGRVWDRGEKGPVFFGDCAIRVAHYGPVWWGKARENAISLGGFCAFCGENSIKSGTKHA
jgi:hypothetical protein